MISGGRRGAALVAVAATATLLGASLGFAVQPLVSRQLLPRLGGGAAVWNTTLVFFQATLLLGYLVTHLTTTRLRPRTQVGVHLAILAAGLVVLPIAVPRAWTPPAGGNPSLWLLGVLCAVVGLPYLAVATTSPLVQRWFSVGAHRQSGDPYFLYAISNVGSFAGLLAVPLWWDRSFRLADQARLWTAGYAAFLLACIGVVILARPDRASPASDPALDPTSEPASDPALDPALDPAADIGERIRDDVDPEGLPAVALHEADTMRADDVRQGWSVWLGWAALAFVPSSLILGVTSHLTTDVASVPLMWVIPLGLYLLTHIIAFARRSIPAVIRRGLAGAAVASAAVSIFVDYLEFPNKLVPHLAALFFVGLACHAELAARRPPVERLTSFYVALSTGGVLGGIFNALVAPLAFRRVIEYPLVLTAGVLLVGGIGVRGRRLTWRGIDVASLVVAVPVGAATVTLLRRFTVHPGWVAVAVCAIAALLLMARLGILAAAVIGVIVTLGVRDATSAAIRSERGFYGAIRVEEADGLHQLVHGTTIHGYQFTDPAKRSVPTSYYGETGPLGQLLISRRAQHGNVGDLGVVGLGVGTIAAYLTPDDSATYYEIDRLIVDIARDTNLFWYLADAKGPVEVVLGDGRRKLESSTGSYDVLVLDAFSSDAIPVHLLTREAFATYRKRLAPGGLLAVHVSNRYLDLEPVVAAIASDLGMVAVAGHHVATEEEETAGTTGSDWVVLAEQQATLDQLRGSVWSPVRTDDDVRGWTDDRADLLSVLIR